MQDGAVAGNAPFFEPESLAARSACTYATKPTSVTESGSCTKSQTQEGTICNTFDGKGRGGDFCPPVFTQTLFNQFATCEIYCADKGLFCVGAWEEVDGEDSCTNEVAGEAAEVVDCDCVPAHEMPNCSTPVTSNRFLKWPSKSGICQCALVGGLVDQDGTYVSHVATTASMPSPATPPIATKNDARPARGKGTAGGWAGLAVGLVTVATVAILLLVRHQRKRGPSADSMLGNCLLGNCNQREQQLKKDLCTAVKERAALGFLAAYNRDLFSSVGSIDEFRDRVAKLEIPRARLKPRGILGTGNYGQVRIASCSGMGGSGGGSGGGSSGGGGGSSGDGGGGGGDPNSLVEQVAVKSRLPTEDDATVDEALLVEALVLHSLKHRHILRLVGICTSTLPVLIATELMVNGDLKSYLRASRPSQPNPKALVCLLDVAVILERVASALSHLESVQIIHRDIAARNILVGATVTDIKLGDLGAARSVFRLADRAYTATSDHNPARWMAPEALKAATFTNKSDCWAFGVLAWEVSTLGKTPYGALGVRDMSLSINAGNRLEPGPLIPSSTTKVLQQMWSADPRRRPRFADLVHQLAAIRGAVAVTADRKLTVNSRGELVPLTGVVARGTDAHRQETDRINRLLAEFGVDADNDALLGIVANGAGGSGIGGNDCAGASNNPGGLSVNDCAQFNSSPDGRVDGSPTSSNDYHQFKALPSTVVAAATSTPLVAAVAGSTVGNRNEYEYLDRAATSTAGTAGQVVVNTTFSMASEEDAHTYTEEVGVLRANPNPTGEELNDETRL